MSKVFQIYQGFCHWECTGLYNTVAAIPKGTYPENDLFVDAPDYVFEGWGYDETQEGDARFIKPEVPEGWLYDESTGTFYPEGSSPPSDEESSESEALEACKILGLIDETV